MLKNIFWLIRFILYMLGTLVNYIKYKIISKFDKEGTKGYITKIVVKWANFVLNSMGAEVEVIGKENMPEGNCVFIANHQGYLDIPIILSQINKKTGFISKIEIKKVPILSTWMEEMGCVFMDRENPREAMKAISKGVENLKKDCSLVIFPEGTRSKSNELGEFKKGSMKLALKAEVKIVPLTIINSFKAYEETGKIVPSKVKLVIGAPIETKNMSKEDQKTLADDIHEIINSNIKKYAMP